ncbi:histidine protein methyltransferase 1 [Tanacetum coccineum]
MWEGVLVCGGLCCGGGDEWCGGGDGGDEWCGDWFNKWSVHFPVATGPRNRVVPNRKPKDKPRFNEGAKRLFIKKQHHREIILKLDPSDHVSTSVMIRNIPNGSMYELGFNIVGSTFNKWSVHFPVATGPRNRVVPNRKPKDKPRFNEGAKRLFIKKQHHREIILKLDPSDHVSTSVMIRNIPNGSMYELGFNIVGSTYELATGPRNRVVPNRKPKDKPRFNEGAKRLFIKKQHHREIILKLDPSDHVSTSVMIRNIPNEHDIYAAFFLVKLLIFDNDRYEHSSSHVKLLSHLVIPEFEVKRFPRESGKRKQNVSNAPESLITSCNKQPFLKLTVSPLRKFQLIDSSKLLVKLLRSDLPLEKTSLQVMGMLILPLQKRKGRASVSDMIGSSKSRDSLFDLVNVLKHEIRDAQLTFRGKRVLELGCGYGLPGTFACQKGASVVHFHDLSAESVRCTTIPNVLANLQQARDIQSRQPEELPKATNLSFSEEDFMYALIKKVCHSLPIKTGQGR